MCHPLFRLLLHTVRPVCGLGRSGSVRTRHSGAYIEGLLSTIGKKRTWLRRKHRAKHWRSALRLVPGCFVLQDVPCAATLVPIALTAPSSSFWRRPVIKTYAPSANNFAVANPIPSVPPVMRAILSLSLLDIFFSVEPRNVLTNRLWVIG